MKSMNQRTLLIGAGVVLILGLGYFLVQWGHGITIGVTNGNPDQTRQPSSIAGLNCDNAQHRPLAVMLESDPEGRPLSGIGQADAVVEMPVTPNGITRFMAVYQCQDPKEIGAIRSAREDFIPLAAGFDSIYAHWGGEHGALAQLDSHIMDDINALQFDGTIFYRKPGIAAPHNGFSTPALLFGQARTFNYTLTDAFAGYPHTDTAPTRNLSNVANTVSLNYPGYNGLDQVSWSYDSATNLYKRSRGGRPEIDKNTNQQVTASVIAVAHTTSHILTQGDQYIVVNTTGQGKAEIYQGGVVISGTWKKDPANLGSKLYFYDSAGKEVQFTPGSIWIEWDPTWQGGQ